MKSIPLILISLCAWSLTHCKTVRQDSSEGKFGGGEHLMIGDEGYRLAMGKDKDQALDKIPRADGTMVFTYGEIVALSGDFYGEAADLDNDRAKRGWVDSLNPLSKYNNVRAVIVAFREEGLEIARQVEDPEVSVTNRDFKYLQSFGMDYLELAVCNTDHFGWHNMKRYVREHGEAIKIALSAYAEKDSGKKEELIRQALIRNGFADHFLTDGFASGHVRIPREQGLKLYNVNCKTASTNEKAPSEDAKTQSNNGRLLGALVKMQHDNDHTYSDHGGLKVINSRGDKWKARADGELYKSNNTDDSAVRMPTEAVRLSVKEIRVAYESGVAPSGLYAATKLVPFIDPEEDTLEATFAPTLPLSEIQKMIVDPKSSLFDKAVNKSKNYVVDLTPAIVADHFSKIPSLMDQFREDVAKDIQNDPELTKRVAPGYLRGFLKVQ